MKNLTSDNGITAREMQQRYVLEEFARKIACSPYRDLIVLKGGFVVSALLGIEDRKTRDIDFTYRQKIHNSDDILRIIQEIIDVDSDCFFNYRIVNVKEEQIDDYYLGYNVIIEAIYDKTRFYLKLDISNNTLIYPDSEINVLKSFIDEKPLKLSTYSIENIIAEKYETTLDRGEFNTRMRDILDVYLLIEEIGEIINKKLLSKTIIEISKDRNTLTNLNHFPELINELSTSKIFRNNLEKYIILNYPEREITIERILYIFQNINEWVQEELK